MSPLSQHWLQIAQYATRYGVGNCQEQAAVTLKKLADLRLGHPIGIANARTKHPGRSHFFPVVGDPRDRRYGTRNSITVGTWEIYPTVTTLEQSKYEIDRYYVQLAANPTFPIVARAESGPGITTDEVNQFLAENKLPEVGPELVRRLLQDEVTHIANGEQPRLYEQLFATDKPDKVYYSTGGGGESFNVVPNAYWKARQKTMADILGDYGTEIVGTRYSPSGSEVELRPTWMSRMKQQLRK